jgi:hypothetical protein
MRVEFAAKASFVNTVAINWTLPRHTLMPTRSLSYIKWRPGPDADVKSHLLKRLCKVEKLAFGKTCPGVNNRSTDERPDDLKKTCCIMPNIVATSRFERDEGLQMLSDFKSTADAVRFTQVLTSSNVN